MEVMVVLVELRAYGLRVPPRYRSSCWVEAAAAAAGAAAKEAADG